MPDIQVGTALGARKRARAELAAAYASASARTSEVAATTELVRDDRLPHSMFEISLLFYSTAVCAAR